MKVINMDPDYRNDWKGIQNDRKVKLIQHPKNFVQFPIWYDVAFWFKLIERRRHEKNTQALRVGHEKMTQKVIPGMQKRAFHTVN